ncbi:MAG: hypothetical protein ABWJ42_03160 [Sulfolobales archaeon]
MASHSIVLRIMLLSIIRKRLILLFLLIVLPIIMINYSTLYSIDLIRDSGSRFLLSERGQSIILTSENRTSDICAQVSYATTTILSRNLDLETTALIVSNISLLERFIRITSTSNMDCDKSRVFIGSILSGKIANISSRDIEIRLNNRSISACLAGYYAGSFENSIIIEEKILNGLNTGYVCIVNSSLITSDMLNSVLGELSSISLLYTLLVISSYTPMMYLALLKILDSLSDELIVLRRVGVSLRSLAKAFVTAIFIITVLTSLYTVSLSYFILTLGVEILRYFILLAKPPLVTLRDIIFTLAISSLSLPLSIIAFKRGVKNASLLS